MLVLTQHTKILKHWQKMEKTERVKFSTLESNINSSGTPLAVLKFITKKRHSIYKVGGPTYRSYL